MFCTLCISYLPLLILLHFTLSFCFCKYYNLQDNTNGFHYFGSTTYVPNIKLAVKNGHHAQTFRDIYMSLKSKLEKANGKFAFFAIETSLTSC